jgi:undecaprenyl diphosphate synthase
MLRKLYERRLAQSLEDIPQNVCFMVSEEEVLQAPEKIVDLAGWSKELGIATLIIHIRTASAPIVSPILPELRRLASLARVEILCRGESEHFGSGDFHILIAIGMSGKDEIAAAIRSMAEEGISPGEVDEELFRSYLTIRIEPDLVIKTGGDQLTDFLIWQSVYSELFFTDINWDTFRKVDFLRALRDYQIRARRFGR